MRTVRFEVVDGEKGPWIDDDDFGYDAAISVSGDFVDDEKRKFLQAVCDVLNENEARIPIPPPCTCRPTKSDPNCVRCSPPSAEDI